MKFSNKSIIFLSKKLFKDMINNDEDEINSDLQLAFFFDTSFSAIEKIIGIFITILFLLLLIVSGAGPICYYIDKYIK